MGVTSNSSSSEGLQLCVFDMRRGQEEGHELDKILFFFPASCPLTSQLSVIGLSEGLITFTRIFSPEAPCEVIDTDKHSHVLYQPEADIWMILVVEKSKEYKEVSRPNALKSVLKEAHCLFTMFFGSIRALLEKQPNGATVRSCLHGFYTDYLSDFIVGKKFQMPSFRESLVERGTIQMLSIGRETALEVQSLVRFLESSSTGSIARHSLILFNDFLVSTTLPSGDTTNLYTYAVLRLTPNAIASGASSRSYMKKGNLGVPDPVSPVFSNVATVSEECSPTSRDTSPVRQDRKFQVPRPLQRERWSREKDGFLMTDIWGTEIAGRSALSPTVWLQQTEERMHLCVYQYKSLTILLLIPAGSSANGMQGISILKQQLLENVAETHFASNTIVLRRLIKVKDALTRMVTSANWTVWRQSNSDRATIIRGLILNESWWDRAEYLLKITEPILTMIRYNDMDRPCLGEVYDGIDSMIEDIRNIVNEKEQDPDEKFFKELQLIMIERWNKMTTLLHLLAFALSPRFYSQSVLKGSTTRVPPYRDPEVAQGYKAALRRLFPEHLRPAVRAEFMSFASTDDCGIEALEDKNNANAHKWWFYHGEKYQHLQPIAIKILSQAYLKILKLEEKLSREWGGGNTYHVAGYRYLFCDNDKNVSRASPPGKVTTLSKSSLAALGKMRAEVDLVKKRAERDNQIHGQDLEVCMRAKNNSWIISRISGGNELYMVLEKASETLLYASDAVEKFSKRYCNGVFSSD